MYRNSEHEGLSGAETQGWQWVGRTQSGGQGPGPSSCWQTPDSTPLPGI